MRDFFFIHLKRKFVRIDASDINYILSINHHVKIHTSKGVFIPYLGLEQMLKILPSASFVRINRAVIICIDKIISFTRDEVFLNVESFFITDRYRDEFISKVVIVIHSEKRER